MDRDSHRCEGSQLKTTRNTEDEEKGSAEFHGEDPAQLEQKS
jgi:hypothetical protein